jgi:hypothetical protein
MLLVAIPKFALAQDEVRVFITGPDSIAINDTVEYTIRIIGGPAEEAGENDTFNWSYIGGIANPQPQGSKMDPLEANSTVNIFKVNITAPKDPRPFSIRVNGTSWLNNESLSSEWILKDVETFQPIVVNITATVHNPTQYTVKGAKITFYLDGEELGNKTEDISANSTKDVWWLWITSKKDHGEHDVEVRINEDGSLLEFDNGDNVMKKTIYLGERPERPQGPIMIFNYPGLLFIIEVFGVIFAFSAFLMRRNAIRGRGYYTPGSIYSMYFMGILLIALSLPIFAVSQILSDNPEVSGDPTIRMAEAIFIFIMGFIVVLFTWDRARKKR